MESLPRALPRGESSLALEVSYHIELWINVVCPGLQVVMNFGAKFGRGCPLPGAKSLGQPEACRALE